MDYDADRDSGPMKSGRDVPESAYSMLVGRIKEEIKAEIMVLAKLEAIEASSITRVGE